MNELIENLSDQAAEDMPGAWEIPDEFCEKFAELLLDQCIGVLNKRYAGDNNREDMEVRRCIEDVKKHFGIEE
jgi:hypothetical protein